LTPRDLGGNNSVDTREWTRLLQPFSCQQLFLDARQTSDEVYICYCIEVCVFYGNVGSYLSFLHGIALVPIWLVSSAYHCSSYSPCSHCCPYCYRHRLVTVICILITSLRYNSLRGYSWWGVGKVEPGPELFFFDSGPDSTFCIC